MSSAQFVKQIIGDNRPGVKVDEYLSLNETEYDTIARVLMTGILKNQYYRSVDDAAKEALPLFVSMAKRDPEFLLKAAQFARNSHMKGMVKVALSAIAGNANEKFLTRDDVRTAAAALLATFHPGQLIQFVELCKSKTLGKGFGSRPQKWVRAAMETWKPWKVEEYTLKYPTAFNQLLRLVHPRFKDEARAGLIPYVLDGRKGDAKGSKQLAVEELKKTSDSKAIALGMIEHNIPWDVIKGFAKFDTNIAMASMTQMGLTALLLNVRSLAEHQVFESVAGLRAFKLKLDEVKDGRAIPLDFAKPYIYATNDKVKEYLLDAMAATLDVPMPIIEGKRVGVSVDISGSMSGEPLQTAGLLAVPFLKARELWFTTFDTSLYEEGTKRHGGRGYPYDNGYSGTPSLKGKNRRDQIKALLDMKTAGGTDVAVSLVTAIQQKRELDLHIVITDEQQNTGTPLMTAWKEYKRKVNPKAHLWIINAQNLPWHSADFNDPSVTVYQTMTPAMFKNLEFIGLDLVKNIKSASLSTEKKEMVEVDTE